MNKEKPGKKRPKTIRQERRQAVRGASKEARRLAGVILEVLAGTLGPGEAATALGKTATQYYKLEARALDGLLQACEPRPRGRQLQPEKELSKLQTAHAKLERECARLQALVRALRKAAGVKMGAKKKGKGGSEGQKEGKASTKPGQKRRKKPQRKPTVRALRLAAQLKENATTATPPREPAPPARPARPQPEDTEQPQR
jgi:hypothetical protein